MRRDDEAEDLGQRAGDAAMAADKVTRRARRERAGGRADGMVQWERQEGAGRLGGHGTGEGASQLLPLHHLRSWSCNLSQSLSAVFLYSSIKTGRRYLLFSHFRASIGAMKNQYLSPEKLK